MKATAIQSKSGKFEQILIDGEVFIKKAPAGRWEYIVEIELLEDMAGSKTGHVFVGKSGSLKAANSWVPYPINREATLFPSDPQSVEIFEKLSAMPGARFSRRRGFKKVTVPVAYTRRIHKIER